MPGRFEWFFQHWEMLGQLDPREYARGHAPGEVPQLQGRGVQVKGSQCVCVCSALTTSSTFVPRPTLGPRLQYEVYRSQAVYCHCVMQNGRTFCLPPAKTVSQTGNSEKANSMLQGRQ